MEEIWRNAKYIFDDGRIIDFSNEYEVSNLGYVRSVKFGNTKSLKGRYSNRKYLRLVLYKDGVAYNCSIHRLVAYTFQDICGKWFEGAVCNHKDENQENNSATNLEWCTLSYNTNYGTALTRRRTKTINGKKSYAVIQYTLDGSIIKEWPSTMEIERVTGLANSNIGNCCRGKYKQAYGYIWKYKNDCQN